MKVYVSTQCKDDSIGLYIINAVSLRHATLKAKKYMTHTLDQMPKCISTTTELNQWPALANCEFKTIKVS